MAFKTVKPDVQKYKVKEPSVPNEDYGADVTKQEVRVLKALEFALAGKSPKEIGPLLDPPATAAQVRNMLRAEIADRKEDLTDSLREKELMRLDKQRNYVQDRAYGYEDLETGKFIPGDAKWHRLLLEVDAEFRKLTGLNTAQELKVSEIYAAVLAVVKDVTAPEIYLQILARLSQADGAGTFREVAAGATSGQTSGSSLLN